ncbi:hypothetical protein DFJ74DRAFT_764628 [Hyaloraphidium curvatum]|nr:hypothetical protein DFJ74DRAFT_764628 [Hyaloraphidium curvatum]
MPANVDASCGNALAPDAAEPLQTAAGDDGPSLPSEILLLVFRELAAMKCKASLLECALASHFWHELAFPVLFSVLDSDDVLKKSFLVAARKHAGLVRELDLGAGMATVLAAACIALCPNLRSLRKSEGRARTGRS